MTNVVKNQCFGKGQKGKSVTNKKMATKWTPNQPSENCTLGGSSDKHSDTNESQCTSFGQSQGTKKLTIFSLNNNPRYFYGIEFSSPLVSNVVISNIILDHVSQTLNANHVRVSNLFEIISIVILMIKMNIWTLELWDVDERLNPQCGEAQC